MAKKIKVAIVDDQHLFADGIEQLLAQYDDIKCLGKADRGAKLLASDYLTQLDILLMDIEMPEMDGFELIEKVRSTVPELKVIVLTMHNEKAMISRMLDLGANGFVTKDADSSEFIDSIFEVHNNNYYFNDHISIKLIKDLSKYTGNKRLYETKILTGREIEVVKLICEEYTNQEIADALHISSRTVENTRHRIIRKLNVRNLAGIVLYAVKEGIVEV